MNCREFVDFLMAYLDGDLPDRQRAVFEVHIEDCPPCKVYLDQYEETVRLEKLAARGENEPPAEAPEELVEAILAARRSS